jgi:hypothetical protein
METLKSTSICIKKTLEISTEEFYKKNGLDLNASRYYDQEYNAFVCIRNFLEDFYHYKDYRQFMLEEEPALTGDKHFDSFLAALCEYLAYHYNLKLPGWTLTQNRFLRKWWFPNNYKFMIPTCLMQSPASFKRRGIFIDDSFFERI